MEVRILGFKVWGLTRIFKFGLNMGDIDFV